MWRQRYLGFFVLGCILQQSPVTGIWSCVDDAECSVSLVGSVCRSGACVCPPGKQSVLGGSACVDLAPYHTSPCVEDHQCSRLSFSFECRRNSADGESGNCHCQPGHHYFLGRCWRTVDFGGECTRSEECMPAIRDPYSLTCDGTCQCSEGYYLRQRGECRRIGYAVGDGCVLNADCQFEGGACDVVNFACYNINDVETRSTTSGTTANVTTTIRTSATSRHHAAECDTNTPCPEPFECSNFGVCLCPLGYYSSEYGSTCYAELGSPSTVEQCVGLLATVIDGVCTCPPNFFFEENMRDCIKVSRRTNESCVTDTNCHTFGAASICGEEQAPWGLRNCECLENVAVWDSNLQMCRLFAAIGERCEVDSDCLAGELEVQCVINEDGEGYCACPPGTEYVAGLCLTTGLVLGDSCQTSQECTGTPNNICENNRCSCDDKYQEVDGSCAPIIGGVCERDSDCVIENTLCVNATETELTCQCDVHFIVYEGACWPMISSESSPCNMSIQCQELLGEASECSDHQCVCEQGHHLRDGGCWPITGLFETCSRSSQCYLSGESERTVCRNSLCQCEFNFPYDEETNTCRSSASRVEFSVVLLAVWFAFSRISL